MILKRPVVILFGAGATRGSLEDVSRPPPPVNTDFFDIAGQLRGHGTQILAKKVLRDVWQLYGKVIGVSVEAYYRDIETRAAISRFAKSANKPRDWKARQGNLEELIRRVLVHTTCDIYKSPVKARQSKLHNALLRKLKKGDTIITFNYDTTIEESFTSTDLWSPIEGYGDGFHGGTLDWSRRWFSDRGESEQKKSSILLLKLHGSLNWKLYPNNQIRIKPRPYVVRTRNKRPSFEEISILPPGWNKRIDRKPYGQFWRTAKLRLEKCRTLVIVGYSLPDTDLLAKALFAEVVRLRAVRGALIGQLHIADPNESIKQKLIDIFTPALGSNGQIYRYSGIGELANKLAGNATAEHSTGSTTPER